jgi:hypothetical protein
MYREWKKIDFPEKVLYMNLETTRLRGRPINRCQEELREDGRLVDGKEWKERVYNREEWKKLLRTARNLLILHMPVERMNELVVTYKIPQITFAVHEHTQNIACL